jgi:hypothetical protein
MKKIYFKILLGLIFLLNFPLLAQIDNQRFENHQLIDSTQFHRFCFVFESFSYLKNNEYFGNISDGYTFFGNMFSPKVQYYTAKNVVLETGFFLKKDFGSEQIYSFQPTFTVKIQKDSLQFLFGNLDGHLNHRLIEPLFDFERTISNRLESGLQLKKIKKNTFFDFWIDWQKMIYRDSPFSEEITGGIHWEKKFKAFKNTQISFPVQLTIKHQGGQINSNKNELGTIKNVALGIKFSWKNSNNGAFVKSVETQNYWLDFSQDALILPNFNKGNGLYMNILAKTKIVDLTLSYWDAQRYQSQLGGRLFQSVGDVYRKPGRIQEDRNLLIIRIMRDWKLAESLWLTARIEPYFDLGKPRFEHSEGIYLNYRQVF